MNKKFRLFAYLLTAGISAFAAFAFASCGTSGTTEHTHNYANGVCTECGQEDPEYIAPENASQGLEYTLSDDGTYYTVSGIGTCADADLIIPSFHENLPVKEIVRSAFSDCASLTSVTIGGGVTSIGIKAFYNCLSLTDVTIPDSVTSVGGGAFYNCTNLMETEDGVKYVDKWAVEAENYGITTVTLRSDTKGIAYGAFANCQLLTSITIPDGVKSIGIMAFSQCTALTDIVIPDSVTLIEASAFWGCRSLASVTIGSGVKSIENTAFSSCTSLTSVTFKNTEGWTVQEVKPEGKSESIPNADLADTATVAKYLTETYYQYNWVRG